MITYRAHMVCDVCQVSHIVSDADSSAPLAQVAVGQEAKALGWVSRQTGPELRKQVHVCRECVNAGL